MPDEIFENPRLVEIYDSFDGQRDDLNNYLSIAQELKAKTILDVGSGTGCLACLLSERGYSVTGLEPALNSLNFARKKPHGDRIQWIHGDTTKLPSINVDLAVMTGNVAQVFVSDQAWEETLENIRRVLNPGGYLVFEVRDPTKKAWLEWTKAKTFRRLNIDGVGAVESWCDIISVAKDLVSFRWTYVFDSDKEVITSDSTLRFRDRAEIEKALEKIGFSVQDVRDAPDRPGKEFVFIAKATT